MDRSKSSTSGLEAKGPKHGKEDPDNTPHVGGNTWAGGTGGRDTAGLGGKGGPYRLSKGHAIHQISDEEKRNVSKEVEDAGRGALLLHPILRPLYHTLYNLYSKSDVLYTL